MIQTVPFESVHPKLKNLILGDYNPDVPGIHNVTYILDNLLFHQKLNGTLPTDPLSCRVIRYSGLEVHSVGPVGDFGRNLKEI